MKRVLTSKTAFFLLCMLFTVNRFSSWGPMFDNGRMLQWDSYGYYLYLPAFFIYDDPGLENRTWIDSLNAKYQPTATLYQVAPGEGNKRTLKYPSGMAVLWSPFFFIAHGIAGPLGYPADGLSAPYSWCIVLGCMLYAFIGLWYLRKVLLHFFSDGIAAVLLILVTMGTNYWQIAASETVMPHSTLFALNCVVLWYIIRWHREPSLKISIVLGLLMGLGIIARPTQVFWLVVPLLWNVDSWQTLKEKSALLRAHSVKVLAFVLALAGMIFIQLAYWKYSSGKWVSYSYEERFAWTSPFFTQFFFSFKKGWLLYTPLMIFCFAGFYFLWKKRRNIFWALSVFVFLHTWIIMSWECWWYASCFSQRGAVDMYGAMIIPLGFLLVHITECKRRYAVPVAVLIGFCFALNLFQCWQYNHQILHADRMTATYYWYAFGRTEKDLELDIYLEPDREPFPEHMPDDLSLVCVQDYLLTFEPGEDFSHDSIHASTAHSGTSSYHIGPAYPYGPTFERLFYGSSGEYEWYRATVWMKLDSMPKPGEPLPQLVLTHVAKERSLKWRSVLLDTTGLRPGEWRQVSIDMITAVALYSDDHIGCVVWNPAASSMYIDDFRVQVFKPREQVSLHAAE